MEGDDVLKKWVKAHMTLVIQRGTDMKRLIGNRNEWPPKHNDNITCTCKNIQGMQRIDDHIVCKGEELGVQHKKLKYILGINSKTLVRTRSNKAWTRKMAQITIETVNQWGIDMKESWKGTKITNKIDRYHY